MFRDADFLGSCDIFYMLNLSLGRKLLIGVESHSNVFGVSAKYLSALEKAGHRPAESHDLSTLHTILSTGSP